MNKSTIVILGGGIGGIVTANTLRKKLPFDYKIILIEKNEIHSFAASYLWLMVGKRTPAQISLPLSSLVSKGVELINAEVKKINTDEKYVSIQNRKINYDYLVISLGADLEYSLLQDVKKDSEFFSFYDLESTIKLRDRLINFSGGKISIVISSLPYKCPGAPFEAAMLISDFFKKKNVNIEVNIFTLGTTASSCSRPKIRTSSDRPFSLKAN